MPPRLTLTQLEDRAVPATITVTNLIDSSYGSEDTIVFAPNLAGKNLLVNRRDNLSDFGPSAFAVTRPLSIQGDALRGITVARNTNAAGNLRLFDVLPGGALTLSNLTLADGLAQGGTGGTTAAGRPGWAGQSSAGGRRCRRER